MAATAKQFELLFQLTARLGPNFSKSFQNASSVMNNLQSDLKSADKKLKDVSAYKAQQNAVNKSKERVAALQEEHGKLEKEIQEVGKATPELTGKLKENEKALQKAQKAAESEEEKLSRLSSTLKEAGINTNALDKDTGELRKQYERLEQTQKKVQAINEKQAANKEVISKTKGQLLGTVGAVTGLAGSFFALDKATEEYRINQGKLNTAFQSAGFDANTAKKAYSEFYKILGDSDTATEASQLLARLTKSEKDVTTWTRIAAGVSGTFGDALPIEGLIESANETAKVGQITGVLADAINWASKEGEKFGVTLKANTKENESWNNAVKGAKSAEDFFNLALQDCTTEAERNQLIMDTLQGTYQNATDAFYKNNKQIIQSRQSQVAWNEVLAQLGQMANMVKNSLATMLGVSEDGSIRAGSALERLKGVVDKLAENPELVMTITKVVAGLAGLRIAGLAAKIGFLQVRGGILDIQKAFKLVKGLGINKYLKGLGGGFGKIASSGGGILNYFRSVKSAAGGVSTAMGGVVNSSSLLTRMGGFFGGITGKLGGVFTATGSKMLNLILQPFSLIGSRLGSVLSGVGGIIARSPLGTIGRVVGAGFGKITGFLTPIGGAVKTILGPLGKLATTVLGPFAGIAGKLLPIVGIVTMIITVFKLVKDHLQEIRGFIQKTFGNEALAVFDKIVAVITNVGNVIKNVFSDGNIGAARNKIQEIFGEKGTKVFDTLVGVLKTVMSAVSEVVGFITTHVVPVAEQVFRLLISDIIPGIISFVKAAAPTIIAIIQGIVGFIGAMIPIIAGFIAGLMPIISDVISFIQTYVLPVISEVFQFITSVVLPAILAAIQTVLPVIVNVLSVLLPFIQNAVTTIWNIVSPIIQGILMAIQTVMPIILAVVQSVIGSISGVISNLMTVLGGIIDFVTGVFTGNWSQAWEGIKSIFSGAVGGLGEIIKAPLRAVISAVNTVIGGLNKLKVPDWVPGLGGKGINIPLIPGFAKGTNRTPDTFIAGENGPELVTGAANRKVFTAAQTGRIFNSVAQAQNVSSANGVNATLGGGASTIILKVENKPTVIMQGGDTNGVKAQLAQYDEEFLEKIRTIIVTILKEQKEQEGRVAYA